MASSLTSVGASSVFPGIAQASQPFTFEVLASGLNSPRGLSFDPNGVLYVTEAGRGGDGASIPSPSAPGAQLFYGDTGAITRIQNGVVERVVTGLPSLAMSDGTDASGIQDIEFDACGNAYAIIGLAGNPNDRDTILNVPDFGTLVSIDAFDGGSSWTRLADLAAYEKTNNPDGGDTISNLYDLLIQDSTAFVIDAGGNDLFSLNTDGSDLTLETVFPARTTTDPVTGEEVTYQSVPTAVTIGPDGAFYVSELTGFPFLEGEANIYRIDANGVPEVYADGFTNVVDLAFDRSGGLFVLEYDADGILSGDSTGALVYLPPEGNTRFTITSDDLISPTGLAIGPDNDIYISNKGFIAGEGEVLRLDNPFDFNSGHVMGYSNSTFSYC